MKKERMIKAVCDGVILLLAAAAAVIAWKLQPDFRYLPWFSVLTHKL